MLYKCLKGLKLDKSKNIVSLLMHELLELHLHQS